VQDGVGRFVAHQLLSTRRSTGKVATDIVGTSRGMEGLEIRSRRTEHVLREFLRGYTTVDVRWKGMRRLPEGPLAIATR
jgi:hypothetical protein